MSYACKNYTKQGGEETVIGGKLTIEDGATVNGIPAATTTKIGGVKKAAAVSDAAGSAPTAAEFKALLDALRTAGILATS